MGEKNKLLSVGDKVTFESFESRVGSRALPDYQVRTVHTVRRYARWNRLTLMESSVKLEQFHESGAIQKADSSGRISRVFETVRPYTDSDGLAIEQIRQARRVLASLRDNDARLLALTTEELQSIADRLETIGKKA